MCRGCLLFARFFAWLALVLVVGACGEWHPKAKPIQPELVLDGSFSVDGTIDDAQHFALITRDPAGSHPRRGILEWKAKKACYLPAKTVDTDHPLFDPKSATRDGPQFFLPVLVAEKGVDRQLYFADEHCKLRGPYGRATAITGITLDGTTQQAAVIGDGNGVLSLVNPWTDKVHVIATGVGKYETVKRATDGQSPQGTQAIWLIEHGALTQRTLQGKKLFSRGEKVSDFQQALYDTLRIAYVDGNDLYEAAGPDFEPVLISKNACQPFYAGVDLNLYAPCDQQQLVRIDLTTGETKQFDKGVIWSYDQAGFLIEYSRDDQGVLHMFATPPGAARTEITPPLVDNVQVVDGQRIVGRSVDAAFRIWDAQTGLSVVLVNRAERPLPFVDSKTSELLWLFLHDIADHHGTLSLFHQDNFTSQVIAKNVPVGGYTVELLAQISEPTIVMVEHATPVSAQDSRLRGQLRARLLSGELGSVVDEDVTSYVSIYLPLPGLLYSVENGPDSGLWFAAL